MPNSADRRPDLNVRQLWVRGPLPGARRGGGALREAPRVRGTGTPVGNRTGCRSVGCLIRAAINSVIILNYGAIRVFSRIACVPGGHWGHPGFAAHGRPGRVPTPPARDVAAPEPRARKETAAGGLPHHRWRRDPGLARRPRGPRRGDERTRRRTPSRAT